MIRDGVFDGATGGVSKPLDEKAVRCCDRWRLKSLSLVLSLLFNPALSQPNLVRAEAVPPISRGQTGLPGTGPAPTPIHGFGNWSEPQDDPFSCQEDPLSAPTPVFEVCSSMLYGHYGGPGRRKWVGIIQIGDARGMGILSGLGGDHQCVVALDLQLAAVEYRVVAEVGIKANIQIGRASCRERV